MNSNLSSIRNAFNDTAVLTDTSRTITVSHVFSVSQGFAGGFTVASGQSVVASGVSITGKPTFPTGFVITTGATIPASGVAFAVGALAVSGIATFATNVTLAAALTVGGALVVAGNVSCAAALDIATSASFSGGTIILGPQSLFSTFLTIGRTGATNTVVNLQGAASLQCTGTQVVGARKTGWTLPTGTLTRTGFTTTGATVGNVAEALAALLVDLHSTSATASASGHGLIGT